MFIKLYQRFQEYHTYIVYTVLQRTLDSLVDLQNENEESNHPLKS